MKRFLLLIFALFSVATAQDIPALRAQRDELAKKGMHRELLDFYREKLLAVGDEKSGIDLEKAVGALGSLGAWEEFDELVEEAVAKHPKNCWVLGEAAKKISEAPHQGRLIAGEFQRDAGYRAGFHRRRTNETSKPNAGAMVNTEYRDKIRALQLLRGALVHAPDDETRAKMWQRLVSALGFSRSGGGVDSAWKLQTLTPLGSLPAWDESGPAGGAEGAPWAGDRPVVYEIPGSWDAAKNDGERVRFALQEIARLSPSSKPDTVEQWADFTRSQFGAETLGARWMPMPEDAKGIVALDTLADDECLARTADGVRRFKLPPAQHFIALYRTVMKENASAGDSLVDEYLARKQYDKAADVLREIIPVFENDRDSRKRLLDQITGNWGRFAAVKSVPRGRNPQLPLVFRNATAVTLTAAPVDVEKLLADAMAYLKDNPSQLEYERLQIENIARRLLEKEGAKYIGKPAGEWKINLQPQEKHRETRTDLRLPIDQPGAWWVKAKMADGNEFYTLAWIVDGVLLRRQVDGKMQWWLADAESGKPVEGADLAFFGYRVDYRENPKPQTRRIDVRVKEWTGKTDANGSFLAASGKFEQRYQWLAVARKEGRAPVYSGFDNIYLRNDISQFDNDRSYGITDRPLYKEGDTVHFKFSLRPVGYGKLDESRWAGKLGKLTIFDGRGEEVAKFENLKTDELGALAHDYVLPKNAVLGQWRATFTVLDRFTAWVNFRIEEYRKPEYEVKVDAPEKPVILGEKFSATVRANYFHGAPVKHAQVEVIVKRNTRQVRPFPVWRWDWLYGAGAWWPSAEARWHPGWDRWGCLPPHPPWWPGTRWTPEETVMRKNVEIGGDGTIDIEIDTSIAKRIHGDVDHEFSIEARVTDASRREERGRGSVIAARKPFEVIVWADRGYARPKEAVDVTVSAITATGEPVAKARGSLRLYQLSKTNDGKVEEKEIQSWPLETDADGRAMQKFPAPAAGQYRVAADLSLTGGEAVEGAMILNVFGSDQIDEWHFGPLEVLADKISYSPGETAKLRVNSDRENASVWLFLRAENATSQAARRIELNGKSLEFPLPLADDDQPNIFVEAVTVHGGEVHTTLRQILLPPKSKAIDVTVQPAKSRVKPREESGLRVTLRDSDGNPLKGTFALTIYDKSLEAITGGSNVGPILKQFWDWKRTVYSDVRDSLPPPQQSVTKDDVPPMIPLSPLGYDSDPFGDRSLSKSMSGSLGGARLEARAPMADAFAAAPEAPALAAAPIEAKSPAGNEAPVLVRKDFADLVKWAGEVATDAEGKAEIPITWPDNLTTWKARVWAILPGTRVGEGTAEVITTKDLLVRMQMPRFLVERDEAVFSAIVHNDHSAAKKVSVSLELEGAALVAPDLQKQEIEIPAGGESRVEWKVLAKLEGEATVRMKVIAADDSDAVEKKLPVLVHGMLRQDAWSWVVEPAQSSAEIALEVPDQLRPDQTKLTIQFSPSVATAVVDAIPYLADYPHGCTEQTLNRFVPTVIAGKMLRDLGINLEEVRRKRSKLNPQELGDPEIRAAQWQRWRDNPVFDSGKLADMTRAGVERLTGMQNGDGGWGWFSGFEERSWPHTTAVVVHGLIVAKQNGAEVSQEVIDRGLAWLAAHERKEIAALQLHDEREALRKAGKKVTSDKRYEKSQADATDAFVRMVIGEAGRESEPMLAYLFRDRLNLPVYARCLLGLELHRKDDSRRDEVIRQISQFLNRDAENQTAYLELPNEHYWWFWYGSDIEANAWFLKLLAATKPKDADTRGLVKYLVNNRKHGTYWNSTRDTAYAIEAIASYMQASGEAAPEMNVKVRFDGKEVRAIRITKDNLFDFDGTVVLTGDAVKPGKHTVALEKSGDGALYANAYLEVFTLEDKLRAAGLEVKVNRKVWKLTALDQDSETVDSSGLVVSQKGERLKREPLADGATLKSGDRIEVELILESKNDYEYIIFYDKKAAGFEAIDALSGYISGEGGFMVYQEPRNQSVDFFIRALPRGIHTIRYQLRAETPGSFKALPATAEAMYAPELRGNSEDIRLGIE